MGSEMLSSLVVKAQHQKHGLQSDIGRKQFGFGREELDGGASYYEGEFKLFLRNGHGTLENTETGLKYVGQFEVDKFHGKGRHVWPDGSYYEGDWRNGRKQGQGTYVSEENLKYTGAWHDGKRHGKGIQEYANGDSYDGWWYNGQCSGLGIYYFADGSQYRGAWSHGKYDGEGLLYLANGDRERMTYLNGRLMKREVLTPSPPPQVGNKTKPGIFCGIHLSQDRVDMMMPTVRPQNHGDVQLLIKRDCDMYDLSAPPIRLPGQRSASEKMADDLLGTSIDTVTGGDTVGDYSSVLTSGPSTDEPTFLTGS